MILSFEERENRGPGCPNVESLGSSPPTAEKRWVLRKTRSKRCCKDISTFRSGVGQPTKKEKRIDLLRKHSRKNRTTRGRGENRKGLGVCRGLGVFPHWTSNISTKGGIRGRVRSGGGSQRRDLRKSFARGLALKLARTSWNERSKKL